MLFEVKYDPSICFFTWSNPIIELNNLYCRGDFKVQQTPEAPGVTEDQISRTLTS